MGLFNRIVTRKYRRARTSTRSKQNIFELQPLEKRVLLSTTTTLDTTADAYVQSGTNVLTNYGDEASLQVKKAPTSGGANLHRNAYLKFDLASLPMMSAPRRCASTAASIMPIIPTCHLIFTRQRMTRGWKKIQMASIGITSRWHRPSRRLPARQS